PPRPPCATLFPYTTLFRSIIRVYTAAGNLAEIKAYYCTRRSGSVTYQQFIRTGKKYLHHHKRRSGVLLVCGNLYDYCRCGGRWKDRKSTRLNSSHVKISYA